MFTNKNQKITILVYCARSGSTFLANWISERRSDVIVIPETRLPLLVLWRSEAEIRSLDAKGLRAFLERDIQLHNLGLSDEQLHEFAVTQAGQGRRAIFLSLLDAYRSAHDLQGNHFLIKNARLIFEQVALREVIPEAQFFEIIRDPRGVVNSMMTTRTVYSYGGPMAGGDPLRAANIWMQHRHAMAQLTAPITQVNYEQFMRDTDSIEPLLCDLFGPKEEAGAPVATKVVSSKERSLHKLVGKDVNVGRLAAWQTNLTPRTGMAVEAFLGDALTEAGYTPHFTAQASAKDIASAQKWQSLISRVLLVKHATRTAMHWIREALLNPNQILFRIENFRRNPK